MCRHGKVWFGVTKLDFVFACILFHIPILQTNSYDSKESDSDAESTQFHAYQEMLEEKLQENVRYGYEEVTNLWSVAFEDGDLKVSKDWLRCAYVGKYPFVLSYFLLLDCPLFVSDDLKDVFANIPPPPTLV